jgi:hypothetical protein
VEVEVEAEGRLLTDVFGLGFDVRVNNGAASLIVGVDVEVYGME